GQLSFEETPTQTTMPDLGFKVFRLSDSNFKEWREIHGTDQEQWKQQTIDFLNPVAENATTDNMVYELLLKNGKNLNSIIRHEQGCYNINSGELILLLESANQAAIDYALSSHPQKVIALDSLFEGNDQLKTNTALQFRDAGINFKTI
ncbi:MAG: site-specific DNA-methyltransferase, partial [Paludibacteraceae bacterium]